MSLNEKIYYLKGLIEGLNIDANSKEGKIYNAIIDVLEDAALSIEDLDDEVALLNQVVDEIDEDLGSVEEELMDDYDEEYYDVECPECGEEITLDEDLALDGEVICPSCGAHFEFEIDDECDDEECECHHNEEE